MVRESAELTEAMQRYADTVWRVCALYLPQRADMEDAFQDTFIRYATAAEDFSSEEHRKAWIIRVTINVCKDLLKKASSRTIPVDSFEDTQVPLSKEIPGVDEGSPVLDALESLPEKYRMALYLTYFEGYKAEEIGQMLDLPVNTVYTNVARGRKMLKEVLTDGRKESR